MVALSHTMPPLEGVVTFMTVHPQFQHQIQLSPYQAYEGMHQRRSVADVWVLIASDRTVTSQGCGDGSPLLPCVGVKWT